MPKLTIFLASLLAIASCIAQTSGTVQQLDAALNLLHQQERFNGTVLYAEKGKILYKKAFGINNIANPQPLQTNAAFNLASVSKQFVAVGILKLFEQRKLDLDAPLTRYIPELPYPTVSVRNLLNHVSGLVEYFELFQQYRGSLDTLSNEGLVKLFAKFHPALEFEPGTEWKYCNTNYVLLSVIIERVSKKPFHDFFQEEIARPLGLKNSYVYEVLLPEIPANHVFGFTTENGTHRSFDLTNLDGVTGDGNIYSSVEDLFTWEQNLYTEKLLTKATLSQALQPVLLKNGKQYPYGFGWFIKKPNEQYWHTGSWQGFRNIIYRDLAKKATLILLSSGDSGEAVQWSKKWFEGNATAVVSTQLITHARVIDGTGIPARNASVRLFENKIIAVGNLQPFPGETITDAGGKVLAPGFIDSHSHIAGSLKNHPDALACLNQGITTIVSGQDGDGYEIDSIQSMLHQIPSAINIATYTGHTSLRTQVMGEANLGRPATDAEIEKMKQILQAEMKKGSLGLSTGLEYEGAYFSSRNEVLELAKATAVAGGRYISHIRSEDINMTEALDEIIEIGRQAKIPVQVSHLKLGLKDDWGRSPYILSELEKARSEGIDITADVYPYDYWHSTLKVLFPKTDYTNLATAQYAVDHTFDPSQSVLVNFAAHPEYAGKTISEIGAMRKQSPAQTIIDLIAEADSYAKAHPNATAIEDIMGKSMVEEDVINFLAWGHTNICSDGSNGGHPRGYGTFTRVLGRYVREKKIMSLETAIQKMTSQSAAQTGIKNRGIIAPGYYADLVLFNPETVTDNANIKNSKALSTGIEKVWVNGICVYEQQQSTQKFPGIFIQR